MDKDGFKLNEEDLNKVSGGGDFSDEEIAEFYEMSKGNRHSGYKVYCASCDYVFASATARFKAEILLEYVKSNIKQCPNCQQTDGLIIKDGIHMQRFGIK